MKKGKCTKDVYLPFLKHIISKKPLPLFYLPIIVFWCWFAENEVACFDSSSCIFFYSIMASLAHKRMYRPIAQLFSCRRIVFYYFNIIAYHTFHSHITPLACFVLLVYHVWHISEICKNIKRRVLIGKFGGGLVF